MARMLLIDQTSRTTTYATVSNDGSLIIHKRYLGKDGEVVDQETFIICPEGVTALSKLLSITHPNNACSGLAPAAQSKSQKGSGASR